MDSGALLVCRVANGFLVAHLADHDDIRVGSQESLHDHGEIQPGLLVDLYLAQALLRDFDRILGGPDLGFRRVDVTQRGMQCGGLARAGRAADEEQAVGLGDQFLDLAQVVVRQAQLVERNRFACRQDTHDHVFHAAGGGDGGDAQFNVERAEFLEFDLAVLRLAPLRDIEIAHDLDARSQCIAIAGRNLDVVHQTAVLAETHLGLAFLRIGLDVDIRSTLIIGIDDDLVDQFDQFVVAGGGYVFWRLPVVFLIIAHGRQDVVDVAGHGAGAVELADRVMEVAVEADAIADPVVAREDVADDT
jgi:hypothetical protein